MRKIGHAYLKSRKISEEHWLTLLRNHNRYSAHFLEFLLMPVPSSANNYKDMENAAQGPQEMLSHYTGRRRDDNDRYKHRVFLSHTGNEYDILLDKKGGQLERNPCLCYFHLLAHFHFSCLEPKGERICLKSRA